MSHVGGIRPHALDLSGTRHLSEANRPRAEFSRSVTSGLRGEGPVPPVEQVVEGEVLGRRFAEGIAGDGQTGQSHARGGRQFGTEVAMRHYALSAYQSTATLSFGPVTSPLVDYYA